MLVCHGSIMAQQKSEINSLRTRNVKLSCLKICGIVKEILLLWL